MGDTSFSNCLDFLTARRDLDPDQTRMMVQSMIDGTYSESETADLLIALGKKGETASELAAAARLLREKMIRFDTGRRDVLDTCGTGGGETGTFNISTATAFVVAGAGVAVVKHGNRAVSSSSGSADVLAELGVNVRADLEWTRRSLDCANLAFCFAPHFHP